MENRKEEEVAQIKAKLLEPMPSLFGEDDSVSVQVDRSAFESFAKN